MTEQRPPRETGRPFRPGRGGFDADAAALAARARYAFRQRVVLGLLVMVIGAVALALIVSSMAWWAAGAAVVVLVAYLAYLRTQVRIEDEVRRRRTVRQGDAARAGTPDLDAADDDGAEEASPEPASPRPPPPVAPPPAHPRAVALDVDDEDPAFDELDPAFEPPYRRAVGE